MSAGSILLVALWLKYASQCVQLFKKMQSMERMMLHVAFLMHSDANDVRDGSLGQTYKGSAFRG